MTPVDAVALLIRRVPSLKSPIEEDDLLSSPHIAYGLLATKLLEHNPNIYLIDTAASFIDELANSGDALLEELLVIDVLEGLAQSPDLASAFRAKICTKAKIFLEQVEREFFGRTSNRDGCLN